MTEFSNQWLLFVICLHFGNIDRIKGDVHGAYVKRANCNIGIVITVTSHKITRIFTTLTPRVSCGLGRSAKNRGLVKNSVM